MKNILLISASAGYGHLMAAKSLEDAFGEYQNLKVTNIDILDYANPIFRWFYRDLYLKMQNKTPHTLGLIYDVLDKPNRFIDSVVNSIEWASLRKFRKLVNEGDWDCFVSTHFLPPKIISLIGNKAPQFIITTDYGLHRYWLNEKDNIYFCASRESCVALNKWGIPNQNINHTGIPVRKGFCPIEHVPSSARKILLIGASSLESIFNSILSISRPIEITVICGNNKKLFDKIISYNNSIGIHKVIVLGFVNNIAELMKESDLVITKPGGSTLSEALACGIPVALIAPCFGQESINSNFILENGCGIILESLTTLSWKIEKLLDCSRSDWNRIKGRAEVVGWMPRYAANNITYTINESINNND